MYGHSQQPYQRQHQRFSWQPAPEPEAPAYQALQQSSPQVAHQQPPAQPQNTTNTDAQNRHFSYAQTPIEHEAFFYVASPTDPPMPSLPQAPQQQVQPMRASYTPIDPRPQSMFHSLTTTSPAQPQSAYVVPQSQSQDEKDPVPHASARYGIHPQPYPTTSPVQAQPYQHSVQPPNVSIPPSNHARKMSGLSPINTDVAARPMPPIPPTPPLGGQTSPLPQKTPITPVSPNAAMKKPLNRDGRQSYANNEPYSPHGFTSNQTNNLHAVFSPDSAHGPNGLDFSLHQPGQISHPNMDSNRNTEWTHSLCACSPDVSTCMTGLFCPCILYGRTAYRLNQKSAKKDPTDMLGHDSTNGHCLLMSLSCGFWWLFPMLQRTRIRHSYKLSGSCGNDLVMGCCCCCCVAVQNEREVKSREESSRRWAGPASADVYTRSAGMVYKPQA